MITDFNFETHGFYLIILGLFLVIVLLVYKLYTREAVPVYIPMIPHERMNGKKTETVKRDMKKDVKENVKDNEVKEKEVGDRLKEEESPKYYYYQKSANELSTGERENILEIIQYKGNLEIKDNTRLFMSYNSEGKVVGVTCILIIDQHDIYGAFSKMGGLNLDLDSVILYNMGVAQGDRRHGIATKLIMEAENWIRENDKKKICLFVNFVEEN